MDSQDNLHRAEVQHEDGAEGGMAQSPRDWMVHRKQDRLRQESLGNNTGKCEFNHKHSFEILRLVLMFRKGAVERFTDDSLGFP